MVPRWQLLACVHLFPSRWKEPKQNTYNDAYPSINRTVLIKLTQCPFVCFSPKPGTSHAYQASNKQAAPLGKLVEHYQRNTCLLSATWCCTVDEWAQFQRLAVGTSFISLSQVESNARLQTKPRAALSYTWCSFADLMSSKPRSSNVWSVFGVDISDGMKKHFQPGHVRIQLWAWPQCAM